MTLPDRMKFRIETPEHSEAIQKALFALGYKWVSFFTEETRFHHTDQPYLYAADSTITFSDHMRGHGEAFFNDQEDFIVCALVKGRIVEGDHGPWDGFIPWFGGECPVPDDTITIFLLRGGDKHATISPTDWRWSDWKTGGDIIAYRVVKEAPTIIVAKEAHKDNLLNTLLTLEDKQHEQDRLDAQRYRWLKENALIDWKPGDGIALVIPEPDTGKNWKLDTDRKIDAAIAAKEEGSV